MASGSRGEGETGFFGASAPAASVVSAALLAPAGAFGMGGLAEDGGAERDGPGGAEAAGGAPEATFGGPPAKASRTGGGRDGGGGGVTGAAGFASGGGGTGFEGDFGGREGEPAGVGSVSSLTGLCFGAASAALWALLSGSAMLLAALHRLAERLPRDHYSPRFPHPRTPPNHLAEAREAALDAPTPEGRLAGNLALRRAVHYARAADRRLPQPFEPAGGVMKDKAEVISDLKTMLADVFAAKASGEAYGRLARAHGYVDGYMRALLELGVVSKEELLDIVRGERERTRDADVRPRSDLVGFAA